KNGRTKPRPARFSNRAGRRLVQPYICVTSSACAEALTIFKRVDETVDHRAEVAGMRGQEVKPSVEAGRFWVAAQIAKVFREHEGAVERGRVLDELCGLDRLHQDLRARLRHRVKRGDLR